MTAVLSQYGPAMAAGAVLAIPILIHLVRVVRALEQRSALPSPVPATIAFMLGGLAFGLIEAAFLHPEVVGRFSKDVFAAKDVVNDGFVAAVTFFIVMILGGFLIHAHRGQLPAIAQHEVQQMRRRLDTFKALFILTLVAVLLILAMLMAIAGDFVGHLDVAPEHQRRGLGAALLAHARTLSPAGLRLFTLQFNANACAFYEKHGFVVARVGVSPPPESEPDVEHHWRP